MHVRPRSLTVLQRRFNKATHHPKKCPNVATIKQRTIQRRKGGWGKEEEGGGEEEEHDEEECIDKTELKR